MKTPPSTDESLSWCRERLLVPGHPLSLTLPYAPPERRDALLALHGLIGEIAAVPDAVSDPDVARRKLAWWHQALLEKHAHPTIRAWCAVGGPDRLDASAFEPLIEAVAQEIRPPRFEQHEKLIEYAQGVAAPAAQLESRLIDADNANDAVLCELAGAAYRVRVVRDMVMDARRDRWYVPLDLQAEYQLTRQQVAAGSGKHRLAALVRHMAGDALITLNRDLHSFEPFGAWRHRHLLLRFRLDGLLARRILRRPLRIARQRMSTGSVFGALAVWRMARKLQRRVS